MGPADVDSAVELELHRVSSMKYMGMLFAPREWVVLQADENSEYQLAYVQSMVHIQNNTEQADIYFQFYQFSFEQLGATTQVNRLLIPRERMQQLISREHTQPEATAFPFTPAHCDIRGFWPWTPMSVTEVTAFRKVSTVQLIGSDNEDNLVFICRP